MKIGAKTMVVTPIQAVIGELLHTRVMVGDKVIGDMAVMVTDGYKVVGEEEIIKSSEKQDRSKPAAIAGFLFFVIRSADIFPPCC
jgi:hypothetical protein